MLELEDRYLDLDKIANSGQCFRWQKSDGGYIVPVCDYTACISRKDSEHIVVDTDGGDEQFWRRYLSSENAQKMYRNIIESHTDNPLLNAAYESACGLSMLAQPFFETCISFIISQNNNIPRIKGIIEKICGGASAPFPTPEGVLQALGKDEVRLGYRKEYVEKFCCDYMSGKCRELEKLSLLDNLENTTDRPSLDEVMKQLQKFVGIGPKVAACIALFTLGYMDCVPRDVWIKRAEEIWHVDWDARYAGFQQQMIFYAQQNKIL